MGPVNRVSVKLNYTRFRWGCKGGNIACGKKNPFAFLAKKR